MQITVVKFGGTSLATPKEIAKAGKMCKQRIEEGTKILCVVSAMAGETDRLLGFIHYLHPHAKASLIEAEVLALGEMLSARLLWGALLAQDIKARFVDPHNPLWPIYIKEGEVDETRTEEGFKKILDLFSQGAEVVVLTGFLARDEKNNLVTLGRGGSDTTALIAGKFLGTEEIVIVTDVEGIYTADPRLFPNAEKINTIDAETLASLSSTGAKVLHPDALKHKGKGQKLKIIHHKFGDLTYEGTVVDGTVERNVYLYREPLLCVTLHYTDIVENKEVFSLLGRIGKTVLGITQGIDYLGFYTPLHQKEGILQSLQELVNKGYKLTTTEPVGLLILRRESSTNAPGMINSIVEPLAHNGINIVELISVGREILLFVHWDDVERVENTLHPKIKGGNNG